MVSDCVCKFPDTSIEVNAKGTWCMTSWMTSGKGVDDLINTVTKKKFNKKDFLTMAKISSWHFCHLLYVVWLKKACKSWGHGHPRTPPGYAYE